MGDKDDGSGGEKGDLMKGSKILRRVIILFLLTCLAIIGIYYWGYPLYRLARINTVVLPQLESAYGGINSVISPNGKWGIGFQDINNENGEIEGKVLTFTSIDLPGDITNFNIPSDLFYGDYFPGRPWVAISWSPSGKSLFLMRSIGKFCNDQHIVMFEENKGKWDGPFYYQKPSDEFGECYNFSWSDDGTELAVNTRSKNREVTNNLNITILNTRAEVLSQFLVNTPSNANGQDFLYWKGTDFIIVNADFLAKYDPDNQERIRRATTIYIFSSVEPENVIHVIDLPRFYYLLGRDPISNRILMASYSWNDSSCQYSVINIDRRELEKSGELNGLCTTSRRTLDNNWIFFYAFDKTSDKNPALLWDWSSLTFIEKGMYPDLYILPWQDALRGFLVLKTDSNGDQQFDVIRP